MRRLFRQPLPRKKQTNMAKLEKPAILVVDMLNDFVTGALTCERGRAIVPATAELQ